VYVGVSKQLARADAIEITDFEDKENILSQEEQYRKKTKNILKEKRQVLEEL